MDFGHEPEYLEKVKLLAQRLHGIEITASAGIFGTSNRDVALLKLRQKAGELVHSIQSNEPVKQQVKALDKLEAALRSAQLLELVSERELAQYLEQVDDIHDQIDKYDKEK